MRALNDGSGGVVNLGPVSSIPPGEGRVFRVDGVRIAIFRSRRGQVFATQAECPHRRGPLADGLLDGDTVICPLHAYRFSLESGQPLGHDCGPLETHAVELSARGEILLRAGGR